MGVTPNRRVYPPRILARILFILLLSILDARFTLYLIAHGAAEVNPMMAFFLRRGAWAFVAVKVILTGLAVTILLLDHDGTIRGTRTPTRLVFYFFVGAFEIVILWELYLIGSLKLFGLMGL